MERRGAEGRMGPTPTVSLVNARLQTLGAQCRLESIAFKTKLENQFEYAAVFKRWGSSSSSDPTPIHKRVKLSQDQVKNSKYDKIARSLSNQFNAFMVEQTQEDEVSDRQACTTDPSRVTSRHPAPYR